MGYKTEINYILKSSEKRELDISQIKVGDAVTISKSGHRTYVLDSPILLADHGWNMVGMCKITEAQTSKDKTVLTAVVLTLFSLSESIIIGNAIQAAEKIK